MNSGVRISPADMYRPYCIMNPVLIELNALKKWAKIMAGFKRARTKVNGATKRELGE